MYNLANQQRLIQKADEIYRYYEEFDFKREENIGAINGLSGISFFYLYYGRFLNSDEIIQKGSELINVCLEKVNQGSLNPSYCYGVSGFGWALDHLTKEGFIEADADQYLINFDRFLEDSMINNLHDHNYDYLHGGLGQGMYFLKRLECCKSTALKTKYIKILRNCIKELKAISIPDGTFFKWKYYLANENNTSVYNLGLSHGQASIISFLAKAGDYDELKEDALPLLKGAADYLLKFKSISSTISEFPNWQEEDGICEYQSRLGWCYGDLGIALSLWKAGSTLNDEVYKNVSLSTLHSAVKRKLPEDTRVIDAGVCHGSFGIAKIFDHFKNLTGNKIFSETADFWIKEGLSQAGSKEGAAGFKCWIGGEQTWKCDVNLLNGVAGIGLCMLDYINGNKSNWDECLLIN
ncbi:lanthionine synthetase C family protein [Christiangramia sp. LLG6405-1]|uniref:lanthionine synthetase C family protein n=1 Tax=Christiangramia sp. LLG6405-1 TaxID=3160832 RepID=UPI00386FB6D5